MTLLEVTASGAVIEWRGPAPFFFMTLPGAIAPDIREAARRASYGWGVVPVAVTLDGIDFTTSLFPRDGGYLLPLRDAVRRRAGLTVGDTATAIIRIMARS